MKSESACFGCLKNQSKVFQSEASLTPVKPTVWEMLEEMRIDVQTITFHALKLTHRLEETQNMNCRGALVCCPWPFCVWMCVWMCAWARSHAWWLNRRWLSLYARLLLWRRSLIASLLPPCLSFSFSRLPLSVLSPPLLVPHFPFLWLTTDFCTTTYDNLNQGNSGKVSAFLSVSLNLSGLSWKNVLWWLTEL